MIDGVGTEYFAEYDWIEFDGLRAKKIKFIIFKFHFTF